MNVNSVDIKSFLEKLCRDEKIAGMAVAVTNKKETLFADGFGVESIERPEVKVTKTSLFRIASITKIVTGMTLLSLVEEGKLSLDAPVKDILPWLTLADKETEDGGAENDKLMRNRGWMKLPDTYKIGNDVARNSDVRVRRILTKKYFGAGDHWLRLKCVSDGHFEADIDFIEFVPLNIISDPNKPEDRH